MSILAPAITLGGLGLFFGVVLAISSKIFHVRQDRRLTLISDALPGVDCGGCGYPGCTALAKAVAAGNAPVGACTLGGPDVTAKVAGIMGEDPGEAVRYVAHVNCRGGQNARRKHDYSGVADCAMAGMVAGGPLECAHGCLGYGSCVKACEYNAMAMENGVAVVHAGNCVACGKCAAACPRGLISIVSDRQDVFVSCSNSAAGARLRAECNIGCIACKLCQKTCPAEAIAVDGNLARIDYSKCTNCADCVSVCPRGLIVNASESHAPSLNKKR